MSIADTGNPRVLRVLLVTAGSLAAAIGCLVLVGGWALGVPALKSVLPGLATMKPNTAVGLGGLGAGLALCAQGGRWCVVGKLAASVALAVALLTLAEYAFAWNAGIDQLIFRDLGNPVTPGRPALPTAVSLTLIAVALLCAQRPRLQLLKSATGVAGTLIAWAGVNGYVFGAELQTVPLFSSVAVHTAIVSLLLGLGVLAVEPTFWPIRTALERSAGGIVCRWLLPAAIVAPPALGWLLGRGAMFAVYPDRFRWAIYSAVASLGSVWLVVMLARRISAMEAERTAATELARRDALTGLANRRAFDTFLLESFHLTRRHRHALSLILLDIDRFKSYNDEYGHPAGDEALRVLGGLVMSVCRETDLAARIGGEEFAIVLPETDLAGAEVFGERLRVAVERSKAFRRAVTVSLGIAAFTGKTASAAMLLRDCDAALYEAKGAGRNRVSVTVAA
ncbi:MAG: GGDEF domain-containing protein [Gammaproteobacteria bacterium]|nr:GGDEF domain-containing protein [Gammaproteobacteria bacterium]